MIKTKKWYLWLVILIVAANPIKAQTCASPITFTANNTWLGVDSFDVAERWHSFTARGAQCSIKLYIRDYSFGTASVDIYTNTCASPISISPTITASGDSVTIYTPPLAVSTTYSLKITNWDKPNYCVYNARLALLYGVVTLSGCATAGTCGVTNTCNLVCNGSFECDNPIQTFGPGEINNSLNWTTVATDNSPDLYSIFGNADWNNQPCNYFGSQTPYPSPNYAFNRFYAGIMAADNGYKEYIQTQLATPLVAGKSYVISAYVSQAENPWYNVTNPFAWVLSSQANFTSTAAFNPGTATLSPVVSPTPSQANWKKISYCYKASGGEKYLIIGGSTLSGSPNNHAPICSATSNSVYNMVPYSQQAYLYIDEVSMEVLDLNIPLTYSICNSNTIQIANTQSCIPADMSLTYTWSPSGTLSNPSILNPIASNTITTAYNFSVTPSFTAGGSCPNITNTVTVYAAPITPPTLTATTAFACPNYTVGLGASNPAYNYTWQPGNLTGSNVVVTFPGSNTTYTAFYTNTVNCTKSATIQVQTLVPPTFTLSATANNYTVCTNLSQATTLTANSNTASGITYTWQPSALTGSQVVVTPTAATIYTLNATLNGCVLTRTVFIDAKNNCCSTTLTAFSATSIPTATSLGTAFAFNNNIVVQPGSFLGFQNAEFVFAPNVNITVKAGAEIHLEGAHLYACGTDLWQGIILEDGAKMTAIASPINDNLVEDALTAVDVSNHTTSTLTAFGAILFIEKTTFNKNFIDINIANYTRTINPYPFDIHACVFTSRSLTFSPTSWPSTSTVSPGLRAVTNNTAGLQVPYLLNSVATASLKSPWNAQPSHKGIVLTNVGATTGTNLVQYAIQIGRTANYTEYNIFDNHGQGIEATNSSLRSFNNVFQNSRQYSYDPPGPAPAYTFGGNGIYSGVNNDFNALLETGVSGTSFSSRFYDCHYAINTDRIYKTNIIHNTIRSTRTSSATVTGTVGISMRTNRFDYNLSNNSIANVHNGVIIAASVNSYTTGSGSGVGIYAFNINLQNNYIGSQTTTAASLGSYYMNQAISISAPTGTAFNVGASAFAIQTNTIDRVMRGIEINSFSKSNFVANTVTNTIKLVDDNQFNIYQNAIRYTNNNVGSIRGNTLSAANTTNTLVSLYYGGSSTTASITCNKLSNSWRAFEFNSSNSGTIWKGNTMTTHSIGLALTGTGVTGTLGSTGNPIDNQWGASITAGTWVESGSDAVFSKMYVRSLSLPWGPASNGGSAGSGQWYSAAGNINVTSGSFSCTSGGGGGGGGNFAASSLASTSSQNIFASSAVLSNEGKYIQDQAKFNVIKDNNLSSSLNTTDLTYYNGLQNSSHGKFRSVEGNLYSGNYSAAGSLNSAITATNSVEQNYKDFYTLYHKYYTVGLNSSDESALVSLANLCPSKDGAIVYQARALRSYIYTNVFYYPNDCSTMFASRGENTDAFGNFVPNKWAVGLFPNPNTGSFSIVSKSEKENLHITVCDIGGKQLLNTEIVTQNFVYLLNSNLDNGVYLVTIKNSVGETVTKKVIVNK